ncbi:hypothetical protein PHJA_000973100 [Phtheirospermum japonicum]|uniref:Uncharacterized protein n=1 Tax=Phtheirospermum japonicum TaxID=374723 RepID=A0A830BV81_9LAMI|nr:hypothetical protein PHJA_000973100 [Phtheirospermum japonicum]
MAGWSAENATNAYLRAIKMGKRAKQPEAAEFISALAAGTNARLIVVACADAADRTTLVALVAAAHQTGGQVVCILRGAKELQLSKENLGEIGADHIKFAVGNAENLLGSEYGEADCIVIDCRIKNCERLLKTAKGVGKNVMVLGYNAFMMGRQLEFDGMHLLPIGDGILVSRGDESDNKKDDRRFGSGKRSRWVVKIDKATGEEHVFRVRASQGNKSFC